MTKTKAVQLYSRAHTYGGSTPWTNYLRTHVGASGMINLVKSPFDKVTPLLIVLSPIDRFDFPL